MIHNITIISRPTTTKFYPTLLYPFSTTMQYYSSNPARAAPQTFHQVPGLDPGETERVADRTLERYTWGRGSPTRKEGKGVSIVWFRNDLRVLDNEVLFKAWASSKVVLPVYCIDPRIIGSRTPLRTQFLMECLTDLKRSLMRRGLNLLIQHGRPEQILPSLANEHGAHTIYPQKETCSEELFVERRVSENLRKFEFSKLELIWGLTMYHIDDLPSDCVSLPDVYTRFRKSVESESVIRSCIKVPASLGPTPDVKDWGCVPEISSLCNAGKGMAFAGGESAALSRVHEYFWKKDLLRVYKVTRNGMLGPDYSTKFSPWLASGSLSPRFIYEEVKRYEKQREANDSTYWCCLNLCGGTISDFYQSSKETLFSIKVVLGMYRRIGAKIEHFSMPGEMVGLGMVFEALKNLPAILGRKEYYINICESVKRLNSTRLKLSSNLFGIGYMDHISPFCKIMITHLGKLIQTNIWYPFVDANMKELSTTGFMSNRGRQVLYVRFLFEIWASTGEWELWFEACLLDYDPCSNYGNWTYGAGVGNDPREDRYFSIHKQAQNYDPDGEFVAYWLPKLGALPKEKRHFPGMLYIEPIVALKFGNTANNRTTGSSRSRSIATEGNNSREQHRGKRMQ
ncbi:Myosin-3 [Orobanche hederae]